MNTDYWKFGTGKFVKINEMRTDELLIAAIHVQKKLFTWTREMNNCIEHINKLNVTASEILLSKKEDEKSSTLYKFTITKVKELTKYRDKLYNQLDLYDQFSDKFTSMTGTSEIETLIDLLNRYKLEQKLSMKNIDKQFVLM